MEDLEKLNDQVSQLYDKQYEQQKNIVDTSTQQAIDEYERNKQKAQEEADKTNRALYTDYQKQINPYGVNAENLYEQGLGKSGLAETTKSNYYNTYQNARSQAQANANNIKADFDAQIAKARQNGDLQLAESAMKMYQQKVNDLYNMYNLNYQKQRDDLSQSNWQKEYDRALQESQWNQAFNQQKLDYTKERDAIADNQWQQNFDYNKSIDDRNYNYQKERDAVADDQWLKQYELSKKNSTVSRSSGRSSSKSSGSSSSNVLNLSDTDNSEVSPQDILDNISIVQGPGANPIRDNLTGNTYNSTDELLASYGYASIDDEQPKKEEEEKKNSNNWWSIGAISSLFNR